MEWMLAARFVAVVMILPRNSEVTAGGTEIGFDALRMKNTKKNTALAQPEKGLSFEGALARLEAIVAEMEAAELPLDDVLQKYEEGTRLVRFCSLKLNEAEKKIELLTKKADGAVALEPFETAETAEPGPADEDKLL